MEFTEREIDILRLALELNIASLEKIIRMNVTTEYFKKYTAELEETKILYDKIFRYALDNGIY